jgi:hypothetical protein
MDRQPDENLEADWQRQTDQFDIHSMEIFVEENGDEIRERESLEIKSVKMG